MKFQLKTLLLLIFAITLCKSDQYNPIPKTPQGFPLAPQNKIYDFYFEFVLDLLNSTSLTFNQVLGTVYQNVSFSTNPPFQAYYYMFPNPSNVNSYLTAKGALIVQNKSTDPQDIWRYIDSILNN